MASFDPVAFGARIRAEMERAGLDVKAFQQQVVEKSGKARGTSYASVWSYVQGTAPLEPRREVIESMADVLGVLPSHLMRGGPRTKEEERLSAATERVEAEDFLEALTAEVVPEYAELDFDARALLVRAVVKFEAAAPRTWFPPDDKTRAYAASFVAFIAIVRQSVFMPLWAWGDKPDLSAPAVRDYIRASLMAFTLSIPKRLPQLPEYRIETYHTQSPDTPHEKSHWAHLATAIYDKGEALSVSHARKRKATARRPTKTPKK